MSKASKVMVISGARKGIGRHLAEHYLAEGWTVHGCSRSGSDLNHERYHHACLDVADEKGVSDFFADLRHTSGGCDAVINNAGIASMNHILLTPGSTIERILATNVIGTFFFCREGAKLLRRSQHGRIVNFSTVAHPLRLEGEAIYAASKAAVESLTRILARELGEMGITVNAVGPTPVPTDLTRSVPEGKMEALLQRQALKRWGTMEDVVNVVDFFLNPASAYVTGQVMYLGGVS
jgi:3-oxoacyl-[acyl-carrier protein] reductase